MSAFITEWNMTAGNFTLPLRSGYTYNMVVDWGDGTDPSTVTAFGDATKTHNYAEAGTFQISITGTCGAWYIADNAAIKLKITKVIQWGDVGFSAFGLYYGFYGARNFNVLPLGPITGAQLCTSFSNTFELTGLTELPPELFYLTNGNTFSSTFRNTKLSQIPPNFFDFTTSASFQYCFADNELLETVPDGLIRHIASYANYSGMFNNCPKLQINPHIFFLPGEENTRFYNIGGNFSLCFFRSGFLGLEGTAPSLWNCNFGSAIPNKTNCFGGSGNNLESISNYSDIPTDWGAVHPKMQKIEFSKISNEIASVNIYLSSVLAAGQEIKCYVSNTSTGLVSPENLVNLETSDGLTYIMSFVISDCEKYYAQVDYYLNSVLLETLAANEVLSFVDQQSTSIINVIESNNIILNSPQTPSVHGTIILDNYLYTCSRGQWNGTNNGNNLVKISVSDYSSILTKYVYKNKINSLLAVGGLDQIVYCSGFLWCATYDGYIVRINPADLDYMIFNPIGTTGNNQPIGTDGTHLYLTTNTAVYKVNTALLLDEFAAYDYTGAAPVAIPPAAILENCPVIQKHATIAAYAHSIQIDEHFIYLAITSCNNPYNGYDEATGTYLFHFQKIDKNTMLTVGDVTIPKCTDDMVMNGDYVFLAPEYADSAIPLYGDSWGLLVINKQTLEIKYLKALHSDFHTANESDRQCYGVFYYRNHVAVQLVKSKKTVIVSLEDIENWGENFPIGGATKAVYSFQIEGVDITAPLNELVLDDNGWVHVNTWETNTRVMKFPLDEFAPMVTFNALSLSYNSAAALLQLLNENYGCSIRCVQDAPGVADGVSGTATDQDGNEYTTVVINEKRWFVENLKTTKFRNLDVVLNVTDPGTWTALESPGHCAYNNEPSNI
jgi:hypothetical protein